MNKPHTPLVALAIVVLGLTASAFAADTPAKSADSSGGDAHKGALYHVVSIKFKPDAKPEQIKAVEEAFAALKTKVPGITSLHWGTNVSPEKRNKGYTHCFVLTFAADKDRDVYLTHPEHQAFGKILGPVLDDVMVIDFWSKE
jgi:stress responsive alpha/beta barrel protein